MADVSEAFVTFSRTMKSPISIMHTRPGFFSQETELMEKSRELTQVKTDTENAHGHGSQVPTQHRRHSMSSDSRCCQLLLCIACIQASARHFLLVREVARATFSDAHSSRMEQCYAYSLLFKFWTTAMSYSLRGAVSKKEIKDLKTEGETVYHTY